MTKQSSGFTIIELLFIMLIIGASSILFFIQKNEIENSAKDNSQKTAINAMYYGLEEVFYPANKFYPQSINSEVLTSVDPALFTDSNGDKLGSAGSVYTYSPTNCTNNKCTGYTLKTSLINEADFVKTNKNK